VLSAGGDRQAAGQMAAGLLMELEDYNCRSIAEAVGHRGPHRLQHLLSRAVWDDQQVLDTAAAWAIAQLDGGDAVLVVDETADEKSSADAVGAARQYSGAAGGIALCEVAVTLTFATSRGHTLIGRALYLPEACAADEEHRELAGDARGGDVRDQATAGQGAATASGRARDPRRLRDRRRSLRRARPARAIRARGMGTYWQSAPTTPSPSARAAP
jgi:hypothetical protein